MRRGGAICLALVSGLLVASCGMSSQTLAIIETQRAAVFQCAAQIGVTPPQAIGQTYRKGGGSASYVIEILPGQGLSAQAASRINTCKELSVGRQPQVAGVVNASYDGVRFDATPTTWGTRGVSQQAAAQYLQALEAQYGSWSATTSATAGYGVGGIQPAAQARSRANRSLNSAQPVQAIRAFCPADAPALYGGGGYCVAY